MPFEKYLNAILWVCAVVLACCIFLLGLKLGYSAGDARLARLEASRATEKQQAADDALTRIVAAQARGDQLQSRLLAAESARQTLALEKDREIRRLTVGRPCLAGAAVRLLNMPDGSKPGAVSEAAGESAPADAGFATDTDVAGWVGFCRRSYDTCRGRLQAIDDFYRGETE